MGALSPEQERLLSIFMPFATERQKAVVQSQSRFVHYTSADAAKNILQSKEVWMRNISAMNDYMEVEHGIRCVANAYRGDDGSIFKKHLNDIYKDITNEVESLFDGWVHYFRWDTYISCVSEHDDAEDAVGRLSMWRAYGEGTGVALVLNNNPFVTPSGVLKAYASPVAYLTEAEMRAELARVADNINRNKDFIASLNRDVLKNIIFSMLRFASICTKHPGFHEEKEWRVVHTPQLDNSDILKHSIETVGGIPQRVYKVPLVEIHGSDFNTSLIALLDRVIVGPTKFPVVTRDAFVELLSQVGFADANKRVIVSDIPLRR